MRRSPLVRGLGLVLGFVLPTLGCDGLSDDAAGEGGVDTDVLGDNMPDDLPAGNCGEDTSDETCDTDGDGAGIAGSSTGAGETNCLVEGCTGQGVCAASWDAVAEVRGEFECRFACIPLLDDGSWCSSDASCCDADARCTNRGYCVLDDEPGGSSTGGEEASTGGDASTSGSDSTGTGGGQ